MAANIQKRDIQTGIEVAWHKLTNVVTEIDKANCGIVYPMGIVPLFYNGVNGPIETEARQVISLDDNGPCGRPVGKDYKLISNDEIWDAVAGGIAGTSHKFVSCGTVGNRATGFISIKVADDFMAANRQHKPMMNIIWGHGGNRAVVAKTGVTCIVCQNTVNMAMREKSDFKLSIRHTANAQVLDLTKAIDAHIGVVAEFKSAMDEAQSVDIAPSQARKVYAGFIIGEDSAPDTKTGITRFSNQVDRLTELFSSGKGNSGRTMADLINGATDFYTHESSGGDSTWKQFTSSEFGAGEIAKREFFAIARSADLLADTTKRGENVLSALGI